MDPKPVFNNVLPASFYIPISIEKCIEKNRRGSSCDVLVQQLQVYLLCVLTHDVNLTLLPLSCVTNLYKTAKVHG